MTTQPDPSAPSGPNPQFKQQIIFAHVTKMLFFHHSDSQHPLPEISFLFFVQRGEKKAKIGSDEHQDFDDIRHH